jgi:uncharacterized protein YbcI
MPEPGASAAEVREEICREFLEVHTESYGTGAETIQVILDGDVVVVVLDVELTPAERTLLDAGQDEAVTAMRESYQVAIEPTFTAIVEHATGRRVIGFLSSMSIEPLYSVEFFRLEPLRG